MSLDNSYLNFDIFSQRLSNNRESNFSNNTTENKNINEDIKTIIADD